jgi:hypothetical protein
MVSIITQKSYVNNNGWLKISAILEKRIFDIPNITGFVQNLQAI